MRTGSPVQVYVTPEMKARLEVVAERNMRTLSAEVVIALKKHLAQEEAAAQEDRAGAEAGASKQGRRRRQG